MRVSSTTSSQQNYNHAPLNHQKDQIRLLQIDRSDTNGHLSVTLSIHDRTSAPSYAALSYTWGDGILSKEISCNGQVLSIASNCWYALKQLRRFSIFDHYWIDSICINQADCEEKSAQVNAMGFTYRQADAVLVSLGKHTTATTYLFDQITTHGVTVSDERSENGPPIDSWIKFASERMLSAFISFASLPYWNRLWTVQEFSLSSEVFVLCGNGCLSWNALSALSSMLVKMLRINRDWFRAQSTARYSEETLNNLPMNRTQVLRATVRDSPGGLANLGDLILRLGTRECLDPRDRIFGILSLVRWPDGSARLEADYSMTAADLAFRALRASGRQNHPILVFRLIEMLEIAIDDAAMQVLRHARLGNCNESPRRPLQTPDLPVSFFCSSQALEISGKERIVPVAGGWDLLTHTCPGRIDRLLRYEMLVPNFTSLYDKIIQLNVNSSTPSSEHGHENMGDNGSYAGAAFALADQGGGIYEIIGNAVFSQDSSSLAELLPEDEENIDFELHLDPQDLAFWAWQLQDRSPTEVHGFHFGRDHTRLGTRFCHRPLSSYAIGTKRCDRRAQRDMLATAASLTHNAAAIREKLALLRIGG